MVLSQLRRSCKEGLLGLLCLIGCSQGALACGERNTAAMKAQWGFPMHRLINRMACESLPEPLRSFYMQHQWYVELHATDADSRRYAAADEACRHFIDADFYDQALPLDSLPLLLDSAVVLHGDSAVYRHGTVPYQCQIHLYKLQWAFEHQHTEAILRYSSDLGHYAADANVPLHTHSNYNGQFSNQHGIHALWETELPYYYEDSLKKQVAKAEVVYDIALYMHQRVECAHSWVTQVLEAEKTARYQVPLPAQFAFVWQGKRRKKMASWDMAKCYGNWVLPSVLQQFSASVETVASLWYTAWVMAGEPLLPLDTLGSEWPISQAAEDSWDHE